MFNKDIFHNQLALNLGYQRIVNDKRINISIDDKQKYDNVQITISIDEFSKPICYKVSEDLDQNDMDCLDKNGYDDIKMIVDAVHQANNNPILICLKTLYKNRFTGRALSGSLIKKRFNKLEELASL